MNWTLLYNDGILRSSTQYQQLELPDVRSWAATVGAGGTARPSQIFPEEVLAPYHSAQI